MCVNCQVSIPLATSASSVIKMMAKTKMKFLIKSKHQIENFQSIRSKVKNILHIK